MTENVAPTGPTQSPSSVSSPTNVHMILYVVIGVLILIVIGGVAMLLKPSPPQPNPARIIESTISPIQIVSPTVVMKEEYSNPFAQPTTYQNPFSSTDNPFDSLAK
ncbi:MAG: hypothetical protein Q7S61_06395 [bacterium]|nr:hypothetical protein [bacterium]